MLSPQPQLQISNSNIINIKLSLSPRPPQPLPHIESKNNNQTIVQQQSLPSCLPPKKFPKFIIILLLTDFPFAPVSASKILEQVKAFAYIFICALVLFHLFHTIILTNQQKCYTKTRKLKKN